MNRADWYIAVLIATILICFTALTWHVADLLRRDTLCVQRIEHEYGAVVRDSRIDSSSPGIHIEGNYFEDKTKPNNAVRKNAP